MKFPFFSTVKNRRFVGKPHERYIKKTHRIDPWLFITIIVVSLFGILMVYDSSVSIAIKDFSDQYYFVREQVRGLIIGFSVLILCTRIDYRRWYPLALPMLLGTLLLLLAVFLPGIGVKALGAHRWIRFGSFVIQPAEFAKLSLLLYLSAWLSRPEKGRFWAFLLLVGMVFSLVMIEPDMGTSLIILCTALFLYILSGAPLGHITLLFPIITAVIIVLAVASPYRLSRITTFLHPQNDPQGASYHIRQVLLGLGSGGIFGVGIGKSRQKYQYLPEANTDSIFAVIGEEVGFIGASTLLMLLLFLIWRCFRIARLIVDPFGKLLASGIGSWIGIQTSINLSAMVGLIPLTGVPLPLISYGGSGLVITLTALGIVLNISRHT